MTSPYRTAAPRPKRPRRPLLCWLGWHRMMLPEWQPFGRDTRILVTHCRGCLRLRVLAHNGEEYPRAVSQDYIDTMRAFGARTELVRTLQRGRDEEDRAIAERDANYFAMSQEKRHD